LKFEIIKRGEFLKYGRIASYIIVGIMFFAIFANIAAIGEPSKNNPRRQDVDWSEENEVLNMTYLLNGNVTSIITPPDIFEFEGNGTVVMWWTVWTEGEENATQRHVVMKIINSEIVRQKINELSEQASLKATNNPAPEKNKKIPDDDNGGDSNTLFSMRWNGIAPNLQELRERFLEFSSHFSS